MGIPVLILGESGSGKSTSMRNFDTSELIVFNVANKLMPFRKKLNLIKSVFGESAFLTREEAERKLKERGENV